MSSKPQLDFHPDAESLNAFAEQALPKQEQEQVLAHLAACSRCRQVVYLAQDAAPALEMTEAAAYRPELDPAAAFRFAAAMPAAPAMAASVGPSGDRIQEQLPWWSGRWRIAWIPAGALAAIFGIVIFVHLRQPRQGQDAGTEMAKVGPQSAPLIEQRFAEPPLKGKALAEAGRQTASPGNAMVAAKKAPSTPLSAPSEEQSKDLVPSPAPPVASGVLRMPRSEVNRAGAPQNAQRQAVAAQANSAMLDQRVAADSALRSSNAGSGSSYNAADAYAAPAMVHGASSGIPGGAQASTTEAPPPAAMKSESLGSFEVSSEQLTARSAGMMAVHKAKTVMLPSGLIAISTVSARQLSLAIDRLGYVYLSQDSGSHWDPVNRQWDGRAIVVRIQHNVQPAGVRTQEPKAGSTQNEPKESTADALAEPFTPPAIFEIINDCGQVWVSTDGKTWNAK